MSDRPSERRAATAGFSLVECMAGVVVLSLLAVGFMKLGANHERLVADLEVARAGATAGSVQPHPDPYHRALGARARRTLGAPAAPDAFGDPDVYLVALTSTEHRSFAGVTRASVELTCNHGQLLDGVDAVLTSVWDLDDGTSDLTLEQGSLAAGVFSSGSGWPFRAVEITSTAKGIDAGVQYMISDTDELVVARARVDAGSGSSWISAVYEGQTTSGWHVWSYTVPSAGVLEQVDVRTLSWDGGFEVSFIEECVLDDMS